MHCGVETYNATDNEKPNNNHHYFGQSRSILSLIAINVKYFGAKVFLADVKVEDSANTDWAEETNYTRLPPMLNLMDASVH